MIVPENRKPSSSLGWLLMILFLPVIGVPLFLILGSPYVRRRRTRIQARANILLEKGTAGLPPAPESVTLPEDLSGVVNLSRALTALPMVTGRNHGVEMDYKASIQRMTRLVEQATTSIHAEIYIMARDAVTEDFFRALEAAVRRGVTVRVLLDHLGSRKYPGFRRFLQGMTAAGIEWHLMMPFQPLRGKARRIDLRNHRKLLVVDGTAAIMGSQNLIAATYGSKKNEKIGRRWNDITVELSGEIIDIHAYRDFDGRELEGGVQTSLHAPAPAVGGRINALQLIPSGPGFRTEPNLKAFASLIYTAKHRLAIVSPYFVPDESIFAAIVTAAFRGVQVELYVSEVADQYMVDRAQSSYYQALLDAGVTIYRFPAPEVLHTKCFLIDDTCAVMGSSNMDLRSFGLNYEISLLAYGGDVVDQISEVIATYAARSSVLDEASWQERSFGRRYMESVMRLTSALQ